MPQIDLATGEEIKYVVLHSHPEKLWMNQLQRDLFFSTGNVIHVAECHTHSFQEEYIKGITRRPLTVVLWGMRDRYGLAPKLGIKVINVLEGNSALAAVRGDTLYPHWLEEGIVTCYRRIEAAMKDAEDDL